jgi:hypothetical protein
MPSTAVIQDIQSRCNNGDSKCLDGRTMPESKQRSHLSSCWRQSMRSQARYQTCDQQCRSSLGQSCCPRPATHTQKEPCISNWPGDTLTQANCTKARARGSQPGPELKRNSEKCHGKAGAGATNQRKRQANHAGEPNAQIRHTKPSPQSTRQVGDVLGDFAAPARQFHA